MDTSVELLSRKANLLKSYLTETRNLKELVNEADIQKFDLEALAECIGRREDIINKIKEIDGLLARDQFKVNENEQEIIQRKWLCDKLTRQIVDAEADNEALFAQAMEKMHDMMKRNSDSIRGINAYFSMELQPGSNMEWKK